MWASLCLIDEMCSAIDFMISFENLFERYICRNGNSLLYDLNKGLT